MKKLALFDLDGTLFNTNEVNYYAYSEALKEKGYSIDYEFYSKYCNGRHYKVFLPERVNNEEEVTEFYLAGVSFVKNCLEEADL